MASNKAAKKKKRSTRQTADYLLSVRNLAPLVPSLRKLKNRKTLTKSQKATIRRREKQLKNIPDIKPITAAQAKALGKKKLFLPGIQGIQLRGVKDGSFKIRKNGDIEVIAGEGRWIYWALDRQTVRSRRGMKSAADAAFNKKFPIDIVADLTKAAFKQYEVQQVNLWAHAGIVGANFRDINSFVMWVNEKWNAGRYMGTQQRTMSDEIYSSPSDPGKWVNGIAILIENPEYTKRRRALEREERNKRK